METAPSSVAFFVATTAETVHAMPVVDARKFLAGLLSIAREASEVEPLREIYRHLDCGFGQLELLRETIKDAPSLTLRKLRAEMELKALTISEIARGTGISYLTAHRILNGRRDHAGHFEAIQDFVHATPMPKEVTE